MKLDEWTKHYIKFQDCMKKQIQSIEETEQGFFVTEKKTTKTYLVVEELKELPLPYKAEKGIIVTYNNKKNIETVVKFWKHIITDDNLSILFVNTQTNEKWHLHPSHHNKIAEDVKKSLYILQESVAIQEK